MAEKIFLLEDDAYLRDGLLEMLQGRDYEVESAESIKKAEIIIKEKRFSLLIFDVMLSDGSSFDLCERLRAQGVTTPILFLTACDEEYQIVRGLDAGGDDYVTKPFETKEVVARIKAVLRRTGENEKTENIKEVRYDKLRINITNYELVVDGVQIDTPPKELELIYHLASNPNRVYTRDQLLDEVWGFDYYGDSRTVDVHVKRLREKLEGVSDKWSLKTVWGVGYKFEVK